MLDVARRLALLTIVTVPLVVWPTAAEPFFVPRLIELGAALALILVLLVLARTPVPPLAPSLAWAAAAWLAAIAISAAFAPIVAPGALANALLPLCWAGVLAWAAPRRVHVAAALSLAATIVSLVAVIQAAGLDPLRLTGFEPAAAYGPRMRVYGTLGNPNFVGAFLAAVLPLTTALVARTQGTAQATVGCVLVLQVLAVALTGSRAAWAGMATAAAVTILLQRFRHRRAWTMVVIAVLAAVFAGSVTFTRSLPETLRGRLYIWSVTAPHLLDDPFTGSGPGSFAVRYPAWELDRWYRGVDTEVRRFAAAQRHAHNDYLQILAELGPAGLIAWLGVLAAAVAATARHLSRSCGDRAPDTSPGGECGLVIGALAGLAALATVALVDFPLQRPVETFTWWSLIALIARTNGRDGWRDHVSSRSRSERRRRGGWHLTYRSAEIGGGL